MDHLVVNNFPPPILGKVIHIVAAASSRPANSALIHTGLNPNVPPPAQGSPNPGINAAPPRAPTPAGLCRQPRVPRTLGTRPHLTPLQPQRGCGGSPVAGSATAKAPS